MIEVLFEWARYVDALTPLLVASGCVVAFEIALLVVARRRLRMMATSHWPFEDQASTRLRGPASVPSRTLESVALLGPTIIAVVLFSLVVRERAVIGEALRGHDDGAVLASTAERVLLPIGIASVFVASLLACVVFALAASSRLRATNLAYAATHVVDPREREAFAAHPSRSPRAMVTLVVGFVSIFLAPIASMTSYATWIRLRAWDEAAGILDSKLRGIFAAERASRAALDCALVSIAPAFVLALLYAAIVLRRTSSSRARVRLLGRQSRSPTTHGDLWRASVALALAIALALLASPMRRENATPWPSDDTRGFELGFATPQVVAPDDGMAGALVVVEDGRTTANRVEVSPDALEARLTQSRQDHAVLFPDASPAVLLICAPSASAARVFDALSRVAAAGIDQVVFGFENTRASVRPLLGPVTYRALSYARVSLRTTPRATSAGVLTIDSGDTRTCDALSSRIGAARRRGQDVSLIVGAAMPVSAPDAPDR